MKSITRVLIICIRGGAGVCATKAGRKSRLAGALADDEKVISELSRRELNSLRDYMFVKNGITKEQQSAYLASLP